MQQRPNPPVPFAAAPTIPPPPSANPAGLRSAYWLLWLTFAFYVVAIGLGLAWDRAWHATHVFDTFFSPPHVFTYSMAAITAILVAVLTFTPHLRRWFGAGVVVPLFRFAVPGPLALTGGGLVLLATAGCLDAIWHSNFGLDETLWSTPHAMIGWGLCITMLGFISCRLALRPYRPLHWYSALVLGFLALSYSLAPFTGPLGSNHGPALLRVIARAPVLLAQPAAEHTFRIEMAWNLTRTNPLFVLLSALWAGAMLGVLWRLDRRRWLFLATVALWSLVALSGSYGDVQRIDSAFHLRLVRNAALWLPPPVLPAALALLVGRLVRLPERWAWVLAGLVFGRLTAGVWDTHPLVLPLTLLAAPILFAGAGLGAWGYRTLAQPTATHVYTLLLGAACVPLIVGIVDLTLRHITP